MFEIAIASVLIAVAFVAVGTSSRASAGAQVVDVQSVFGRDEPVPDLPCPWCLAQTNEDDAGCRACGQPFG
jgi:hypothetical protein